MLSKKLIFVLWLTALLANVDEYISQINTNVTNGKFQDAIEIFDKALLEFDASSNLYYLGAQISIRMDDLDQANKYFVKSIELDPKNEEYRSAQQRLAELKDALTKIRKTFDSGLIDEAIVEYEKLTNQYSENAEVNSKQYCVG